MSDSNKIATGAHAPASNAVSHTILAVSLAALILAVYPFSNDPAGDVKHLISAIAALGLVASFAMVALRSADIKINIGPCAPLLLLWLAASVVSAAQAENTQLALLHCARFAALVTLYFVTAQFVQNIDKAENLMRVLCGAAALASLYGLLQYFGWDPLPWDPAQQQTEEYRHAPATYGNPNLAGHVLVLIQIMLVYFAFTARKRWWLYIAPVVVTHHAITGHRTGYLALAAALLLTLIARRITKLGVAAPQRLVLRTIVVCGVVALVVIAGTFGVQLFRVNNAAPNDLSAFLRINSLWSAARMAMAYPLLGVGPGNFQIGNAQYWSPYEQDWYATERKLNSHVHNDLLETAVETGVLGAACHLGLILLLLFKSLLVYFSAHTVERCRFALMIAGLTAAFAVDGITGFNLRSPVSAALFFVIAGVCDGVFRSPSNWEPRVLRRALPALFMIVMLVVTVTEVSAFASQVLLLKGRGAAYWKNFAAADAMLARAQQFAPWNWMPPYERGIALQRSGDRNGAVTAFERALSLNPSYLPARIALCNLALEALPDAIKSGNSGAAFLDYVQGHVNATLAMCPNLPEANEIAGRVAMYRAANAEKEDAPAQYQIAVNHLRDAIAYSGELRPDAYALLAGALTSSGDLRGAEAALARAVEIMPESIEAWQSFEQFAFNTSRTDALLYALERRLESLLSLKSQDYDVSVQLADAYLHLGNAYTLRRDTESANRYYRAAARLKAPTKSTTGSDGA
ncbi:MAG: O-antigen ligase family protein [Candidatus Hydrogenedentes bacterium]|nr:O-antigen ligase family protein [Candidatus Hydrogenedentota bacterium]